MNTIYILSILFQIVGICIGTYTSLIERKYCRHCEWWSDCVMYFMICLYFIPLIGTMFAIASYFDCRRNVARELRRKQTNLEDN